MYVVSIQERCSRVKEDNYIWKRGRMYLKYLKMFLIAYPVTIFIDLFWIRSVMRDFYHENFVKFIERFQLQGFEVKLAPALLAWMLMVFGAIIFVVPLVRAKPLSLVFAHGAFFGLIVYGIYDLTNLATITSWPAKFAMIDIGWGMILCGILACLLSYLDRVL